MKMTFAKKIGRAALALFLALALFSCQNNVSPVDSTGTGSSVGIGGYTFPDATSVRGKKNSYVYDGYGKANELVLCTSNQVIFMLFVCWDRCQIQCGFIFK